MVCELSTRERIRVWSVFARNSCSHARRFFQVNGRVWAVEDSVRQWHNLPSQHYKKSFARHGYQAQRKTVSKRHLARVYPVHFEKNS